MNTTHEANRRYWNDTHADEFKRRDDETGLWRRCAQEPEAAFDCEMLDVIREFISELAGKKICLVGSGNNHAAFALAALGARVTSTDQSERQLEIAAGRADELELAIDFVRADASALDEIPSDAFDLVCSTNGFFVWLADLGGVYREVHRILKSGGHYIFYEIHPFQRPWGEMEGEPKIDKPYSDTGPFSDAPDGPYYFHWTMGDLLNALADAGLSLRRLRECSARDGDGWDGTWYGDADLPVWLLAALQKRTAP